jgi:AmmeMemoRadiSam system protein B
MKLFPLNEAIPFLRDSIQFSLITEDDVVVVYDTLQLLEKPIAFHSHIIEILELINGENTIVDIHKYLHFQNDIDVTLEDVQTIISYIDEQGLLESESFSLIQQKIESDFIASPLRKAVCAGSSYPAEKEELLAYLDDVFTENESVHIESVAALIPHIDFRVGIEPYIAAYQHIRHSKASVFFVIGTSHYGYQDQFILTKKDFDTPLGVVKTNKDIIETLHTLTNNSLTKNDIAHKPEHSIEFHAVILKYLFPDRDFTIVPILVTSFHHFVSSNTEPKTTNKIQLFSSALKSVIQELGEKAYVISSGDLSHIGLKFGDEDDAYLMKDSVTTFDSELLDSLEKGDNNEFFSKIQSQSDRFRICGLPPTYTLLNAMEPLQGKTLALQQWYEEETKSMVSFGSVLFQYSK